MCSVCIIMSSLALNSYWLLNTRLTLVEICNVLFNKGYAWQTHGYGKVYKVTEGYTRVYKATDGYTRVYG